MPAYFLTLRQVIFSAFLLSVLVVHVPAYAVDDCGSLTSFPVCDFADIHCQPCNGRCISEQSICILEPLPGGIDEITASQTGNLGAFYRYLNGGVWRWAFGVGIGAAVSAGVFAGLQIVLSNGDSGKIEAGKNRFLWAIVGLLILLLAGVLLHFINPIGFQNV